jgi:hypothetical protein
MGLNKEMIGKSGAIISYWKITDWRINQASKTADIMLTPYISNIAREEGYEPLRDEARRIRASDYILTTGEKIRTDYSDFFSPSALEKAA